MRNGNRRPFEIKNKEQRISRARLDLETLRSCRAQGEIPWRGFAWNKSPSHRNDLAALRWPLLFLSEVLLLLWPVQPLIFQGTTRDKVADACFLLLPKACHSTWGRFFPNRVSLRLFLYRCFSAMQNPKKKNHDSCQTARGSLSNSQDPLSFFQLAHDDYT